MPRPTLSIPVARWTVCVVLGGLAACFNIEPYTCDANAACIIDGVMGVCDAAESRCKYESATCSTGFQDGSGRCVTAPARSGTIGSADGGESTSTATAGSDSGGTNAASSDGT